MRRRTLRRQTGAATLAIALVGAGTAYATHLVGLPDTEDHTTLEQVLQGDGANFETLSVEQVNEDYIVREPASAPAQDGRESRRTSLAYVAQLTDFQLSDEESPARVEFLDPGAASAHRPQEFLAPFYIDTSIRQVNRFAPTSPVPQGDQHGNAGNSMDFALLTGDQADNQQRNEMIWLRTLLEGDTATDFGSGVEDPAFYSSQEFLSKPSCLTYFTEQVVEAGGDEAAARAAIAAEAAGYTGVQDNDDYPAAPPPGPAYYDPDDPTGQYEDWPTWTGLLDRAQTHSFTPVGLDVPSYWTNGNHDALAQGNEDTNQAFEDIATACFKALGTTLELGPGSLQPDPNALLAPANVGMLVPPDPLRRYVDKRQIKAVIGANDVDDKHGFGFVSPAENTASADTASYYAWDPLQAPGFRFINVDTVAEGGQTAEGVGAGSSHGNIDDPQFQWLTQELNQAQADDKLIVLWGHHPVRSMDTEIFDEQATQCTVDDSHGDTPEHDFNPGCDRDPRISQPVHLGQDPVSGDPRESFVELLDQYPNVLAYIAGHTHEHRLIPFERSDESVWWEINTSSTLDWPQQHRLVEVMDNRDGTLSIFGTVLDHASDATSPPAGDASSFDVNQLASIGRTLSYNDPQNNFSGEGSPDDRNVEMLLDDPRKADLSIDKTDDIDPIVAGNDLTYTVTVSNAGPSTATAPTVTDQLPPTVQFDSTVTPAGVDCTHSGEAFGGTVTCDLPDIDDGDDVSFSIVVTPQTAGMITNQASVDSVTNDPAPGNNSTTEDTEVDPIAGVEADLSITKADSPDSLFVGEQLTYTLSVQNGGPDTATGVAITDPLPSAVNLVSSSASQGSCSTQARVVTCTLGSLASGATATATLVVTPQTPGIVRNTATVASGATDPNTSNNSSTASSQVLERKGAELCGGETPTITGTDASERIVGTPGPDVIDAGAGNDRVNGKSGDDVICGRAGKDRLAGRKGDDRLFGGPGRDKLKGNKGDDLCRGGPGKDRISRSCERR